MTSTYEGFTAEERAAMKDHAKELKKASSPRGAADKAAEAARDVVAKIAEMNEADRVLAERVHSIILDCAPALAPRLWYGMPAYALDGKLVCHFQPSTKFKTRYATITFADAANLDEGAMWPVSFALTELTPESEAQLRALLKQAVN